MVTELKRTRLPKEFDEAMVLAFSDAIAEMPMPTVKYHVDPLSGRHSFTVSQGYEVDAVQQQVPPAAKEEPGSTQKEP